MKSSVLLQPKQAAENKSQNQDFSIFHAMFLFSFLRVFNWTQIYAFYFFVIPQMFKENLSSVRDITAKVSSESNNNNLSQAFVLAPTPAQLGKAPGQLHRKGSFDENQQSELCVGTQAQEGSWHDNQRTNCYNSDSDNSYIKSQGSNFVESGNLNAESSAKMPPPSTPGKEKRYSRKLNEEAVDK